MTGDEIVKVIAALGVFFSAVTGGVVAMRKAFPPRADITARAIQSVTEQLTKANTEVRNLEERAANLRSEVEQLRRAANSYADYVHDLREWITEGRPPPPPDYPEGLRA